MAAYFAVQWEVSLIWKDTFIIDSSFSVTIFIYWYLVRSFNLMQQLFGMKKIPKLNTEAKSVSRPNFQLTKTSNLHTEKSEVYPG